MGYDYNENKVPHLIFMELWIRNNLNKLDLLTPQDFYYELCSNGKYKSRPNRTFYSVEDINKFRESHYFE